VAASMGPDHDLTHRSSLPDNWVVREIMMLQAFISWLTVTELRWESWCRDLVFVLDLVIAPICLRFFELGFVGANAVMAVGLGRLGSLGIRKRRQQGDRQPKQNQLSGKHK